MRAQSGILPGWALIRSLSGIWNGSYVATSIAVAGLLLSGVTYYGQLRAARIDRSMALFLDVQRSETVRKLKDLAVETEYSAWEHESPGDGLLPIVELVRKHPAEARHLAVGFIDTLTVVDKCVEAGLCHRRSVDVLIGGIVLDPFISTQSLLACNDYISQYYASALERSERLMAGFMRHSLKGLPNDRMVFRAMEDKIAIGYDMFVPFEIEAYENAFLIRIEADGRTCQSYRWLLGRTTSDPPPL